MGIESRLHQIDPRVKVVTAFLLIIGIVLTPSDAFPAYPLLWMLVASLAITGGIGAWRLAKMAGVVFIFTIAALPLLFTTPGQALFTVGGISISETGAERFFAILMKSWLSAQVALLLSLTTPFPDLLGAFAVLRLPAPLVAILAFMYRYLFILREESERLLRARAARSGQKAGGKLLWRAKVAGNMVGNLFLRSYERSERVQAAMLARGYTGERKQHQQKPLPTEDIKKSFLLLSALVLIELAAFVLWHD